MPRPLEKAPQVPPRERHRNSDPVTSELRDLIEHVSASIHVVDSAIKRAVAEDPDTAKDFFILDDISPRYRKIRLLLDAVHASLTATLDDA